MTLTLLISEEVKYITYINPLVSTVAVCTTCCSGQSLPSSHLTFHVACSTAQSTVKDGKACAPPICPNSRLPFGGHAGKTPPSRSLRASSFLFEWNSVIGDIFLAWILKPVGSCCHPARTTTSWRTPPMLSSWIVFMCWVGSYFSM